MIKMYTMDEAAYLMNISKSTVKNLVRDGKLKTHRLGPRTIRISEEDLNQFVDDRKANEN